MEHGLRTYELCAETVEFCPDGRVFYLGYPLVLTPAEGRVLRALWDEPTENWIGADTLCARCAVAMRGTLSTHIAAINRKAMPIGGRPLILCRRGSGYRRNIYP